MHVYLYQVFWPSLGVTARKGVQGNCNTQPHSLRIGLSGAIPPPLISNQCMVVLGAQFLLLDQSNLWVDGLMLRSNKPLEDPAQDYEDTSWYARTMIEGWRTAKLWMTAVAFQVLTS